MATPLPMPAYFSPKALGPAYVNGSTAKVSEIWSDRGLLVREKQ